MQPSKTGPERQRQRVRPHGEEPRPSNDPAAAWAHEIGAQDSPGEAWLAGELGGKIQGAGAEIEVRAVRYLPQPSAVTRGDGQRRSMLRLKTWLRRS